MMFFSILFFLGCGLIFYGVYIMKKSQKNSEAEAVTPPKNKGISLIIVAIILFVISGIGILITDIFKPDPPDAWKTKDNKTMAYVMMQEFVKRNLVSPGSAKFEWISEPDCKISKDGFEYTISSWVDSQNSFGALIRTRFTGVVRQVDKDNWELVELEFDE
jgi:flagellar basal body-associated protein FliL